jgi:hypothetical protein
VLKNGTRVKVNAKYADGYPDDEVFVGLTGTIIAGGQDMFYTVTFDDPPEDALYYIEPGTRLLDDSELDVIE